MRKDCEVWDASHVEADRQFRIALGVNLNYDSPSGHVSGRTRDLRRCHTARPAPRGPEIHQHRDAGVRDDFVEQLGIHFERFVYRGHGGFRGAAATSIGKMCRRNTIFSSANLTNTNRGHRTASALPKLM